MCMMCQLLKGSAGVDVLDLRGQKEAIRAEYVELTTAAIRARLGNRVWVHGFLFRYAAFDHDTLIELAELLDVRPDRFVTRGADGVEKIGDWTGVYEAVVDAATAAFQKNIDTPRVKTAQDFDELLTILCGKPTNAEERWMAAHRN